MIAETGKAGPVTDSEFENALNALIRDFATGRRDGFFLVTERLEHKIIEIRRMVAASRRSPLSTQ